MKTLQDVSKKFDGHGGHPALILFQKDTYIRKTFRELKDDVESTARKLGRKIPPREKIALLAPNGYGWIVTALAVIRAGGVVVPVDTQMAEDELEHVLKDSRARLIFTTDDQKPRLDKFQDLGAEYYFFDGKNDEAQNWRNLPEPEDNPHSFPEASPDETAVLFYTSGTTGPPKGVPLTHKNLLFQIDTVGKAGLIDPRDRLLLPLPLHHVYPFVIGMLVPLSMGITLVLPYSITGPQITRALKKGRVTAIIGVPRLYRALFESIESRLKSRGVIAAALGKTLVGASLFLRRRLNIRAGKFLLAPLHRQLGPKLRLMASGGSALSRELHEKLEAFGWRVGIGYGLTETSPLLTLNRPEESRAGSAGRPVPGVEIRIDGEKPDQPGEVLASGPGIFQGYHGLADKTKESFTGDGWFKTGDKGYFDLDGYLYLTGRVSTMIVTESGENVHPDQLEDVYLKHALIEEIGIFEKNGKLAAVVVPNVKELQNLKQGERKTVQDALMTVGNKLPRFQRISDFAVSRESLPRTRLGKIRRHMLAEIFERSRTQETDKDKGARQPIAVHEMSDGDQALLENPAARKLWNLIAERYKDRRLTPDTSPQLDLDIDSLEWINITLEIQDRIGAELDEQAVGRIETIRDLLKETAEASEQRGRVSQASVFARPETVLSENQRKWLEPPGAVHRFCRRCMIGLLSLIMRVFFPVRVEGLRHLPEKGPYVLTPNHVSYLDPFAVGNAIGRERLVETCWAGWTGIAFHNVLARLFSRWMQVIPIDAERAALSSLAFGAAVLKRGKNLVWFPEGRRSHTGKLVDFKQGLGILLTHFDVPVIPVIIYGTFEAWPAARIFPRPHRITVVIGEPVDAAELKKISGEPPDAKKMMQALSAHMQSLREKGAAPP